MKEFKKKYKFPACTKPPWAHLIPQKIRAITLLEIKQECITAYGHSLNECPKRKLCIGKECLGRPLPWLSETAKPYLEELKKISNIENDQLKIETNCNTCAMASSCCSPCQQIEDFINRDKSAEQLDLEIYSSLENVKAKKLDVLLVDDAKEPLTVPWDCVSEKKQQIVKLYIFEQKDYLHIAKELGLYNQAATKYEFYSALSKLSKVACIRKFFQDKFNVLNDYHKMLITKAYFENKNYVEISKEIGITPQAVQQIIKRVFDKYRVKWNTYIRRKKGKVIYTVPNILK